jgi:hypothetical protein
MSLSLRAFTQLPWQVLFMCPLDIELGFSGDIDCEKVGSSLQRKRDSVFGELAFRSIQVSRKLDQSE